jgi:hypothetical protein
VLLDDFASFALRAFRELNPRTLFAMNWHIELIAAQVDSTAQMLDWLKQSGREPQDWLWQMYKEQQRTQQAGAAPTVKPEPLSVMAKRLGLIR